MKALPLLRVHWSISELRGSASGNFELHEIAQLEAGAFWTLKLTAKVDNGPIVAMKRRNWLEISVVGKN
jgi:hypothetical protein